MSSKLPEALDPLKSRSDDCCARVRVVKEPEPMILYVAVKVAPWPVLNKLSRFAAEPPAAVVEVVEAAVVEVVWAAVVEVVWAAVVEVVAGAVELLQLAARIATVASSAVPKAPRVHLELLASLVICIPSSHGSPAGRRRQDDQPQPRENTANSVERLAHLRLSAAHRPAGSR
jgi:hypothetical protein